MSKKTAELLELCKTEYEKITKKLIETSRTVSVTESCTGGLVASLLTDTEGASATFFGSYVAYSNRAKEACGVSPSVIDACGVYSEETAVEMANACKKAFGTTYGIGVTGSFGNPDPNNADSVPGEVWFALASERGTDSFFLSDIREEDRTDAKLRVAAAIAKEFLKRID